MEGGKPRIVALPFTAQGHFAPMMHLCGHLAELGFSVTVALPSDRFALINSRGTWPPPGADITLESVTLGHPFSSHAVTEERVDLAAILLHTRGYQQPLEELVKKLGRWVVCLICDYQLAWGIDVAIKLGVPGAVMFTGCVTWSWFELQMPRLVSSVPTVKGSYDVSEMSEDEDHVLLEHPRLVRSEIPWHFWNEKELQEYTAIHNSGVFEKASWVLSSSVYELEPEMVDKMKGEVGEKHLTVGPVFLLDKDPVSVSLLGFDSGCMHWLDKQLPDSVIYIAFGSSARLSMEQLEELAAGLGASRQSFLWVLRSSHNSLTSEFYAEFQERTRDRGLVVSWAPQTQVLSHPSVGAFLSHSGWNSTMEAVTNGKPILSWPCEYEQNINRRLIVKDWKVGTGFARNRKRNLVDRTEVERVLRTFTKGDEGMQMRKRAHELSSKVKKAALPGGSSYENLQTFIRAIANSE